MADEPMPLPPPTFCECGHTLRVHSRVESTGKTTCLHVKCDCTNPKEKSQPRLNYGFGQCRRVNCVYRTNRCVWGFCRNCCVRDHHHETPEDIAPLSDSYRGPSVIDTKPMRQTMTNSEPVTGALVPVTPTLPELPKLPTLGKMEQMKDTEWSGELNYGLYEDKATKVIKDEIFEKVVMRPPSGGEVKDDERV